jgi:hypothetical protein
MDFLKRSPDNFSDMPHPKSQGDAPFQSLALLPIRESEQKVQPAIIVHPCCMKAQRFMSFPPEARIECANEL